MFKKVVFQKFWLHFNLNLHGDICFYPFFARRHFTASSFISKKKKTPTTISSFCSTLTSFFSLGPLCSLHFAEHLYSAPFHHARLPAGISVLSASLIIWPMSRYQLLCSERCNSAAFSTFLLFCPQPSTPHARLVALHYLSSQ